MASPKLLLIEWEFLAYCKAQPPEHIGDDGSGGKASYLLMLIITFLW